jgi:hypothetical protein
VRDDIEVVVLAERIEGQPQPEALGQRDLFLDRLARMQVAVVAMAVAGVVRHLFRHQVAPVRGRVDQHIVRLRRDLPSSATFSAL